LIIIYELGPALGTKREPCENHGLTRNCNSAPITSEKYFRQNKNHCPPTGGWEGSRKSEKPGHLPDSFDCFRELEQNQIDEFI